MSELDSRFFYCSALHRWPAAGSTPENPGPLPWSEAQETIQQIGETLSHAHELGLVHRGVKPQNILISKTNGAVLTDFGLVRAMESSGVGTRTGVLMGPPAYMAPEIWQVENVGSAADQ